MPEPRCAPTALHLPMRMTAALLGLAVLAACEPGPNGYGTAPAGVSQAAYEAEIDAKQQARQDFYRGPRGGMTGR